MIFKRGEVYKCSQIDWNAISVVVSVQSGKVTFRDIEVHGAIDKMNRWEQALPIGFKSPKPKYELIGTKETHPEYFL